MHDALCAPLPVQPRLPILIGGSGPTKTLRTTARYADLWNGYGPPEKVAATSEILRERCAEVGRPYDEIERTVTVDVLVRDSAEAAQAGWTEIARSYGIENRTSTDGEYRGLTVGGPVAEVAEGLDAYRRLGIGEIIFVFRHPFDLETIERLGEIRTAMEALPSPT